MNWRQAGLLGWLFAYTFILYLVDMIPPEPWKSHIIIFMVQNILGIEAWPLVRATTRAGQDPLASQRLRIHRRLVEGIILLGASVFIYRLSWFGTGYISVREKEYPVILILTILYDTIWYAIARSSESLNGLRVLKSPASANYQL